MNEVVRDETFGRLVIDPRGRVVALNERAAALFGYRREELLGQSIEMLVPERFRTVHPALRDAFQEAPVPRPMGTGRHLYGRRSDGSEIPMEITLDPVEDDEGRTLVLVTVR